MATKRPVWIPVVTGLIRKGNTVLVGQRPQGHTLSGQWEFPGGKIENHESPESALKRELSEELGIDVEVGDLKLVASHSYGEVSILLIFYEVLFWKGEPKPVHHTHIQWVEPKKLKSMDIPEANQKILDKILKILEPVDVEEK
jgi:8-oxo-dGTP diphosphatase